MPDFIGKPMYNKVVKVTGTGTANTNTVLTTFTYDNGNSRLAAIDQTYNSQALIHIATYSYNELGQLVQKSLEPNGNASIPSTVTLNQANSVASPNSLAVVATTSITISPNFTAASGSTFTASISPAALQTLDYRYNIRGQLLSINNSTLSNDSGTINSNGDTNDLFGMNLLYDQVEANVGNTGSYTGRISGVKWMTKNSSNTNTNERSYKYTYDALDRLTASNYAERLSGSSAAFNLNVSGFDESGLAYDENGNLVTLKRNSSTVGATSNTPIDNLLYTYNSANPNQLQSVTDGTGSSYTGGGFRNLTGSTGNYVYDTSGNGNLITDPYKGLTIGYNSLNRTDKITINTAANRYINYTYDAGGSVIRKQQYDNNVLMATTDYIDGFVYISTNTNPTATLSYFPMPEGRSVYISSTSIKPEYIITDQQGNARFSFQDNGSGGIKIMQEDSYYAFGLTVNNSPVNTPTVPNTKLYNGGSEWQNDYNNLPDYYQTGIRNYDAALGRFVAVDPMAETAEDMTAYQYAGNNPVMNNDPTGNAYGNTGYRYPNPYNPNAPPPGIYPATIFGDATNYYNGSGSDTDLLAAAETGDPDALAAYTKRYGTIVYQAKNGVSIYDQLSAYHGYDINYDSNGSFLNANFNASNQGAIAVTRNGETISEVSFYAMLALNGGIEGSGDANQGDNTIQNSNNSDNGNLWPHLIGPGMIAAGQPWVSKAFITPGASKGTSIASKILTKALPYESPVRLWSPVIRDEGLDWVGTKVIGRFAGRWVPWIGWALTAYDVYNNRVYIYNSSVEFSQGLQKAQQLNTDGWMWEGK